MGNSADSSPVVFTLKRKARERMMGREKTREEDDWEILCRKVVLRVEKLCEVVFDRFFARYRFLFIKWISLCNFLVNMAIRSVVK